VIFVVPGSDPRLHLFCSLVCSMAHSLPIDATSDTRHEIAWALVGLGLFVPGAAVRPPAVRLC
jgi:hypothetical protein